VRGRKQESQGVAILLEVLVSKWQRIIFSLIPLNPLLGQCDRSPKGQDPEGGLVHESTVPTKEAWPITSWAKACNNADLCVDTSVS